ncbi:MAG: hypothetical protein ACJ790_02825 [Myxococcaceae bacterium]
MFSALVLSLLLGADPIASPLPANVKRVGELDVEIEVNGKPGRIPYGETSWRSDEAPTDVLHVRDVTEVMPLRRADVDNVQLYSRRLATTDPFPELAAKFPEGARLRAKVVAISGAKASLNISGVLARVERGTLSIGDEPWVMTLLTHDDEHTSLTVAVVDSEPSSAIEAKRKLKAGAVVSAAIRTVTANAAVIDLGGGALQWVRASELRRTPIDKMKVGGTLRVLVRSTSPVISVREAAR